MRIAILSHWHTASTLVAKTLQMCGMQVGNAETKWDPSICEAQCEHSLLNGVGDKLLLGQMREAEARNVIEDTLKRYDEEAKRNDWKYYGFKVTHALQDRVWPLWKECFEHIWDDVCYVCSIREPLAIVASTSIWSMERVLKSWYSSLPALSELIGRGAIVFYYPVDWITRSVQEKTEEIGLKWNPEAMGLFDPSRPKKEDGGRVWKH